MKLDQKLVDAAIELMKSRFSNEKGGAAALYTETGKILTSLGLKTLNASANLCRETGAILEATKLGEKVTASVCVYRDDTDTAILILTPCGICQERLMVFGEDVEVAIPQENDPTKWEMRTLGQIHPHYWGKVFKETK